MIPDVIDFEILTDYFKRAGIELGTITWPNEQDFSPETIEIRMEKA